VDQSRRDAEARWVRVAEMWKCGGSESWQHRGAPCQICGGEEVCQDGVMATRRCGVS
jgi:hypothetical protein